MFRFAISAALALFVAFTATAADPAPGKYKLLVARGLETDLAVCILTLDQKDGLWSAKMVGRNTALGKVTVGEAKMQNGFLQINMNISDEEMVFEGAVGGDGKSIVGTCGNDRLISIASLTPTDEDVVVRERMRVPRELPPPMKELVKLELERIELQKLLDRANIVGDYERLNSDLENTRKRLNDEQPKLFAKMLADFSTHPAACEAGISLLCNCGYETAPDQLKSWTEATLISAARLGPRCRRNALLLAIEYLGHNPKAQSLAAELAERADREFVSKESLQVQSRVLTTWVGALTRSGQEERASELTERLAKIEEKLDEQYRSRLPKLAVSPFGKRRDKANCVAFMELFIGAEGQSGIASGLAFDKLFDAYKPTEAIAIQYHLHTPLPDALANSEGERRFGYYAKKFPGNTNIVPASFFNGRPWACGGGKISEVQDKFKDYCSGMNPLVNAETVVKLSAKAKRSGDLVDIEVKVEDIPADSRERKMRLRIALVEDMVRYPAGNGLRFHRNVFRAMPGGSDGAELNVATVTRKETVDINQLRKSLDKELDKLAANGTPLPGPYRPLEFKNLKIICWVQTETDRAVWQAVQADVSRAMP